MIYSDIIKIINDAVRTIRLVGDFRPGGLLSKIKQPFNNTPTAKPEAHRIIMLGGFRAGKSTILALW